MEFISIVNRYDREGNISASPLWDEYLTDEYLANFEKNVEAKGAKEGVKLDIQRSNVLTAEEKRSILNKAEDIKNMSLKALQAKKTEKQEVIILNPEVKHFNQMGTVKQMDHTWKILILLYLGEKMKLASCFIGRNRCLKERNFYQKKIRIYQKITACSIFCSPNYHWRD